MRQSKAIIIVRNPEALRVAASSARISTQQGTAMEIYGKSLGDERDLKLINKVLSSGHKSVIEHQTFSIAFNDVSVLVEQFVIEARLASYTVKSRRYVDFSGAGYVIPEGLTEAQRALYTRTMDARFKDYQCLLELGVPKEDARFVFPYCLRSNFFMTVNARELIALICAMLYGRGKDSPEIAALGQQLMEQFDAIYPGVIDAERSCYARYAAAPYSKEIRDGGFRKGGAKLVSCPGDAPAMLESAMAFSGRFAPVEGKYSADENLRALLKDARPRELEMLYYTFRIQRVSLACLTHFARHRIQSPLIPQVYEALAGGDYVLPESVAAIDEARTIYKKAFADQAKAAREALRMGMQPETVSYFALSGHQLDILLSMNARELMHFVKLRSCSRAQWEIQSVTRAMLSELRVHFPELFELYGPSCRYGRCPEGKMSCGKPQPGI